MSPASWVKIGAPCWYRPVRGGKQLLAGVIATDPWQIGDGTWVAHVTLLEPNPSNGSTRVGAAWLDHLTQRAGQEAK